jgi:hypothetical protein
MELKKRARVSEVCGVIDLLLKAAYLAAHPARGTLQDWALTAG